MTNEPLGMRAMQSPRVREAARVLVLDANDRVFLFRGTNPARDLVLWLPPGGGLEQGETFEDAAKREVWEELGLKAQVLSACIWERRVTFVWGDEVFSAREHYFACRVESLVVDESNWEDYERELTLGYRWWSAEEILAAPDEVFIPRDLGRLLPPVLRGELPVTPLHIDR